MQLTTLLATLLLALAEPSAAADTELLFFSRGNRCNGGKQVKKVLEVPGDSQKCFNIRKGSKSLRASANSVAVAQSGCHLQVWSVPACNGTPLLDFDVGDPAYGGCLYVNKTTDYRSIYLNCPQ